MPAKSSDISGLSPVERQVMSSFDVTSVGMVTMPTLGVMSCERVRCPSQATRMFEKTDILKQGQDIYFRSISCHACCTNLHNHDSSQ